jgi:hypothetical protein
MCSSYIYLLITAWPYDPPLDYTSNPIVYHHNHCTNNPNNIFPYILILDLMHPYPPLNALHCLTVQLKLLVNLPLYTPSSDYVIYILSTILLINLLFCKYPSYMISTHYWTPIYY